MRLSASLGLFLILVGGCADRRAAAAPDSSPKTPASAASAGTDGKDVAPPGVDLTGLLPMDRAAFFRMLRKYPSACGKAQSLEASLKSDAGCHRSFYAARYIAHLLQAGLLPSEVEEHYDARFGPHTPVKLDLSQTPMRGDVHAPVTIVEFSDFQCPHCKHLEPVIERLLDENRGKVRLYYLNFPISSAHPDAAVAAAAALAAGKQGKFWQFHDALFAGDQEHEAMPDLEKIARQLKLDVPKWKADMATEKAQVAKDRAQGEQAGIDATPTLFIDGRKFVGPPIYDEIKDWVDEELNR